MVKSHFKNSIRQKDRGNDKTHKICALDCCDILNKSKVSTEELSEVFGETPWTIEKVRTFNLLPSNALQHKIIELRDVL